ncbi:CoA pyrophosphatase [Pelomyxa schiedti]|nr:CoA pyrophosphatase [Pelomyxa schiedti]
MQSPTTRDGKSFKDAGVLALLVKDANDGSVHLLYTLRTKDVGSHKGEVSFPGGKFDIGVDNSFRDTALREAEEEVGLRKESVDVLGDLDPYYVSTGFCIHPVVGVLRHSVALNGVNPNPNVFPPTACSVTQLPTGTQILGPLANTASSNTSGTLCPGFPVYFFKHPSYNLWGATAHITLDILKRLFGFVIQTFDPAVRPTPGLISAIPQGMLEEHRRQAHLRDYVHMAVGLWRLLCVAFLMCDSDEDDREILGNPLTLEEAKNLYIIAKRKLMDSLIPPFPESDKFYGAALHWIKKKT